MEIEKIENFDVSKIDIDDETFQGRVWYDDSKLESIINDMRTYGQRSPIGIRKSPNKKEMFQIIYGFHRVKAILRMEDKTIYSFLYSNITDRDCEELAVRDNEMHADLTPMEKVLQCSYLKEEKGWTVKDLCEAYSVKGSIIYEWLQVAKAPRWLLQLLHINKLSIAHIANLLRAYPKTMFDWVCDTVAGNWSVFKLEKMMKFSKERDKKGWGGRFWYENGRYLCGYLCPKEFYVKNHMCHGRHRVKRRRVFELKQDDNDFAEIKRCEYCIDEVKRCPKLNRASKHGCNEVEGTFEWVLCSYQVPEQLKPFWDEYSRQRNVRDKQDMLDEMLKGKAISEEKYKQYSKMDLQILPKYPSFSWRPDSEESAERNSKPFTLKEQIRLENIIASSTTLFSETLNNLEQLPGTETKEWLHLVNECWIWNDHCSVCGERYWVKDGKYLYNCEKVKSFETKIVEEISEETGEIIGKEIETPTINYIHNKLTKEEKSMCFECYVKKKDEELRLNVKKGMLKND